MAKMWIVDEFVDRLQGAEKSCDAKALAELFAADAELLALTRQGHETRPTAALQFWNMYLNAFDVIRSKFTNIVDDGSTAVLEWHSSGQLPTGLPIEYSGVSIFEYSGENKEQRIKKFRTYYDSAALLPHASHSSKSHSESVGEPVISTEASS